MMRARPLHRIKKSARRSEHPSCEKHGRHCGGASPGPVSGAVLGPEGVGGALCSGAFVAALSMSNAAFAQNARGSATGPTSAPGYDHPGQYIHLEDVKPADNMYPVMQHPEQDKAAQDKLAALQQKTGKRPNILIFLLDDVGWMDPGFNGGGVAVGNATPNMDKLGRS